MANYIYGEYPLPFDKTISYYIDQDCSNLIWLRFSDINGLTDKFPESVKDEAFVINNELHITLNTYNKLLKLALRFDSNLGDKLVDLHTEAFLTHTESAKSENNIEVVRETPAQREALEAEYSDNWNIGQDAIEQLVSSLKIGDNYIKRWQQETTNIINKTIDGLTTKDFRYSVANKNHQWVSQSNSSEIRALKGRARALLALYIEQDLPKNWGELKILAESAAKATAVKTEKTTQIRVTV
jgi:hypothetical protein